MYWASLEAEHQKRLDAMLDWLKNDEGKYTSADAVVMIRLAQIGLR
jgi:hypothetical protein